MNRKLNIAIFNFGFLTGGTERQIIELLKGLDRDSFNVKVAAVRTGGELEPEMQDAGLKIDFFPLRSMKDKNAFYQLYRLRQYLISNKIDLLHTFSYFGNTFGAVAGALARTPVIVSSRRDLFKPDAFPPYSQLQVVFSRYVDAIITNAQSIKQAMVDNEQIPADKISVINNGLDLNRFYHRSCGAAVRRELGISETAPVLAVVAGLKEVKGHIYLFKAIKLLKETYPELRLLVIGECRECDYRAHLEAKTRQLEIEDQVKFLGRSDEVPRLLTAVDISVLPSLSEGLSNTILESMAAGLPMIATRVGGNIEIIEDGENGLLVPPRNEQALADAISSLINDRSYAAKLARKGEQYVINQYSNQRMISKTSALYMDLVEAKIKQPGLAYRLGLRRQLCG